VASACTATCSKTAIENIEYLNIIFTREYRIRWSDYGCFALSNIDAVDKISSI
jgi:hypothetical protein